MVHIVAVALPFNTILPVPNANTLVFELLLANKPVVRVKVPNASVPAVSVVVSVLPKVKLPCNVHAPPTPLKVNGLLIVMPPLVKVLDVVAVNVTAPVILHTVPAIVDRLPATLKVGVVPVASVTVPALTVMSKQASAPVIVTV